MKKGENMKAFLRLTVLIIVILCLAACGKDSGKPEKGESRKGGKKVTEEPTLEATPTEEPTPTANPTEEPTPTPTSSLPVPEVFVGPDYVVAKGDGCDRYCEFFIGEGPAFDSELDYLYITSYGYPELAAAIRQQNLEENQANDKVRMNVAKMFEEITAPFGDQWFEQNTIHVWRCDSKVFSYARLDDTYLGGAHPYAARTGHTFNTKTGEKISLDTLICDRNAMAEDMILLLTPEANRSGFWDNWKDQVKEAVLDGTVGWVATDDGLQVWFNNGYLAPYASGEICVDYKYEDFPDRFVWEWMGAYGEYTAKDPNEGFVRDYWYSEYSEQYVDLLKGVVAGMGKMSWEDLAIYLKSKNVEFEGYGDKEAAGMESDAYAIFNGIDSTDRIYVTFWPEDETTPGSTQRMNSIALNFKGYEFFLLVGKDDDGQTVCQIIDCSFEIRDAVVADSLDDAMKVLVITMHEYYDDIRTPSYN